MNGCLALHTLTIGNTENQLRPGKAGAMKTVVAAIRGHTGSRGFVHQQACAALGSLTDGTAENKIRAGNAGAVKEVVAALHVHLGNEGLQIE